MYRNSRNIQPSSPVDHPSSGASRWLVIAVALCGALAGGSIVEAIAALAAGASISFSPGHLIAEPLALAGALSGGLLAAMLASRDRSGAYRVDPMLDDSLTAANVIPSEPVVWQPAPYLLPVTTRLSPTSIPPARSKRRIGRIHHGIRPRASHIHQGRLAVSRLATMKDASRLP